MTGYYQYKKGYKYIGCANGWPILKDENGNCHTQYPPEVLACKMKGHQLSGWSTRYGEHHTWCDECKIEWDMDSGD